MDDASDSSEGTRVIRTGPWGWQRRVVFGILVAIGLYYAVGLPLVALRFSQIPLGLVFIALAIAVSFWWPRPSTRDSSAE